MMHRSRANVERNQTKQQTANQLVSRHICEVLLKQGFSEVLVTSRRNQKATP